MSKQISEKIINKELPEEISNIINNFYLDIESFNVFKTKIKNIHSQLKNTEPILHISEELFDWFLDFEYAIRLPELLPC